LAGGQLLPAGYCHATATSFRGDVGRHMPRHRRNLGASAGSTAAAGTVSKSATPRPPGTRRPTVAAAPAMSRSRRWPGSTPQPSTVLHRHTRTRELGRHVAVAHRSGRWRASPGQLPPAGDTSLNRQTPPPRTRPPRSIGFISIREAFAWVNAARPVMSLNRQTRPRELGRTHRGDGRDDGGIRCGQLPPAGGVLHPRTRPTGTRRPTSRGPSETRAVPHEPRREAVVGTTDTTSEQIAIETIEVPFRSLTVRQVRLMNEPGLTNIALERIVNGCENLFWISPH